MAVHLHFPLFMSFLLPLIFCAEIPEFLNGQNCDPNFDLGYYPVDFTISSPAYLFCDNSGKFSIYSCQNGQIFDSLKRSCIDPDWKENLQQNWKNVENGKGEIEKTTKTNLLATIPPSISSSILQSTSIGPTAELVILKKEKGENEGKMKMKKENRRGEMAMNDDSNGIGTKLMVEKNSGKGTPKINILLRKELKVKNKSRNGGMKRIEGGEWKGEMRVDGGRGVVEPEGGHYSVERKGEGILTEMAEGEWADERQKLEEIKVAPCVDGSPPLVDNSGMPHLCLPDYGHNPSSPFSCPFLYECQLTGGQYSQSHCCPQNGKRVEEMSKFEAAFMDDDFGQNEWENAGQLGLPQFCPFPGHSPQLDPLNGLPKICHPNLPMTSCPIFSECQFSRRLFQYICCQSDFLSEMINKFREIAANQIWNRRKATKGKSGQN